MTTLDRNVTILGLGAMGSRMAQGFLDAGYATHVWNRSKVASQLLADQGAIIHATPKEAAMQSHIVISMVRDDNASKEVWLDEEIGAINGLNDKSIAIESSTLSYEWILKLSDALNSIGSFIEAPVVGSRPQAEAGQLIYLLGGDSETISTIEPLLKIMAGKLLNCGSVGQATAIKLAVNTFFAIQTSAIGELFSNLMLSGISKKTSAELFSQLPTTSPAVIGIANLIAADKYDPLFPVELVSKDLEYQIALYDSKQDSLTHLTSQKFRQAIQAGYSDENIHAVAKLMG